MLYCTRYNSVLVFKVLVFDSYQGTSKAFSLHIENAKVLSWKEIAL